MEIDWATQTKGKCEIAEQCLAIGSAEIPREEQEILMAEITLGMLDDYKFIPEPKSLDEILSVLKYGDTPKGGYTFCDEIAQAKQDIIALIRSAEPKDKKFDSQASTLEESNISAFLYNQSKTDTIKAILKELET